jgi:hypothetical protein
MGQEIDEETPGGPVSKHKIEERMDASEHEPIHKTDANQKSGGAAGLWHRH